MSETSNRGSHAQGADKIQKQASQLAYDVKYKVKQSLGKDTKMSPAQVSKAYLAQLSKSPAPPAVKALAKKKLLGEEYISDIKDLAEKSVVDAMFKIFVEGIEYDEEIIDEENSQEKKYKIRVTDKKTGNTYIRTATRSKISELRANPNISSVEMTSYGEVSDDEKSKGSLTAKAKAGKGLDPVGKEDDDVDNDGDSDESDRYLLKRRKAIGKAIKTRKEEVEVPTGDLKKLVKKATKRIDADVDGDVDSNDPKFGDFGEFVPSPDGKKRIYTKIKEEYYNEGRKENKLEILKGKRNKINLFPDVDVKEEKMTTSEKRKEKRLRKKYDESEMKQNMIDKYGEKRGKEIYFATIRKQSMSEECGNCGKSYCECESDSREVPTKVNLLKNKMRSKGIKVSSLNLSPRNTKTYDDIDQIDEVVRQKFDMEAFKEKLRKSEGAVFHDDPQVKKSTKRGEQARKSSRDNREKESAGRYRSDTPAGKRYQGD